MLLFSVMWVMVLYLKGPVMPAQTAGLSGTNPIPPAQDTGRVLYQAPTVEVASGDTNTGTLPDQPTASTWN